MEGNHLSSSQNPLLSPDFSLPLKQVFLSITAAFRSSSTSGHRPSGRLELASVANEVLVLQSLLPPALGAQSQQKQNELFLCRGVRSTDVCEGKPLSLGELVVQHLRGQNGLTHPTKGERVGVGHRSL